tara:strand:+ start:1473 stop:2432 length:960 start_codon:yes stop_codon:yes gene_type:complete
MNYKIILKIFIPLTLGIIFIYLTVDITSDKERKFIFAAFNNADLNYIGLSLFFGALSHLSRGYRWLFLLNPMGYKPKLSNAILTVFIGYLANLGIPRSGEVLRATFLSNYENIPFQKTFGSIVTERIIDALIFFMLVLAGLIIQFETIWNLLVKIKFIKIGIILCFIFLIIILSIYIVRKLNLSIALRLNSFLKGFLEGISSIKKTNNKFLFIFHTIFIWVMYLLMFYVIKWSIPETQVLTIKMLIPAFIVGALSIITTNGGIGIYPLSIALVLSSFEISKEIGLSFGWIIWSTHTILIIILGALAFILIPFINRRSNF